MAWSLHRHMRTLLKIVIKANGRGRSYERLAHGSWDVIVNALTTTIVHVTDELNRLQKIAGELAY